MIITTKMIVIPKKITLTKSITWTNAQCPVEHGVKFPDVCLSYHYTAPQVSTLMPYFFPLSPQFRSLRSKIGDPKPQIRLLSFRSTHLTLKQPFRLQICPPGLKYTPSKSIISLIHPAET